MLKHTWFRQALGKMDGNRKMLATAHFNLLWDSYSKRTELNRVLYQNRQLSLTAFRQAVKREFQELRQELRERLRLI